jgi:periplasmic protein TonB
MAKPLRSELTNPPSVQFRDFGVLNDGSRSKGAAVTSIVLNVTLAALVVILGIVVKTNPEIAKKITEITLPPEPPPIPKPVPKPPPPPPPKPLPQPPVPPKIKLPPPPDAPPDPKPIPAPVLKPTPVILPPAPPKKVDPPPAPVKVSLAPATAASIPNHDANPSPVKLGSPTNPLKSLTGAATSPVNLGNAGMPGMRASNTGNGPNATKVVMGSGSPNGSNLHGHDNAAQPVAGIKLGVPGGTGPIRQPQAAQTVQMGAPPPPPPAQHTVMSTASATPPKILYKPTPVYTDEAKSLHLEGKATVSVIFHANGTMEVIGLVHGLGHGLDDSALQAAKGVRFQPALDATGRPIDFPTQIIITFALIS